MVQSIIRKINPSSIENIIERFENEGSESYRLTLLHKNNSDLCCFLSGNLQEISSTQKIDVGITMVFSKKIKIDVHYDIEFKKREIKNGYYYVMFDDSPGELNERVIPFGFVKEPPSVIVHRNLEEKLIDCLECKSQLLLDFLEELGEGNSLKVIYDSVRSKKWKNRYKKLMEYKKSLQQNVSFLFHEESSPSTFILPTSYISEDATKKTLFVRESDYKNTIVAIPLIAFMPNTFLDYFEKEMIDTYRNKIDTYRNKFGQSKEEEMRLMLSEFFMSHPKARKGIKKILEFYKPASNLSMYALQAGLTALAYRYTPSIIGYPFFTFTLLSGCTIATNLIISRGKDSSGIISTLLRKSLTNKLE